MSTVDGDAPRAPGVPVAGELAGWWQRVGASVVDGLLLGVPTIAIGVATGGFSVQRVGPAGRLMFHSGTAYIIAGLLIAIVYLFCTLCRRGPRNGQTLGNQLLGIRIVRDDGHYFNATTLIVREIICKLGPGYVLRLLPGNAVWLLVTALDDLWPLWDSENRALHDFVAKTHVIRA